MVMRAWLACAIATCVVPCCLASSLTSSAGQIGDVVWDECVAPTSDGHEFDCEDTSHLQIKAQSERGEPRAHLTNVHKGWKLASDDHWKAGSKCESGRCDWFKLEVAGLSSNGLVRWTTIRTDWHPQSLLDKRNLHFQGGAWDGYKFYDQNRWWGVVWGERKVENQQSHQHDWVVEDAQIAFFTYHSRNDANLEFLAMRDDGSVYLEPYPRDASPTDLPKRALWSVSIAGSAWSPKGVLTLTVWVPLTIAAGVATGGIAWMGVAGAAAATGVQAGIIVGTAGVLSASAVISGSALTFMKTLEKMFFVV